MTEEAKPFRTRPVVGAVRSGRMAKVAIEGECPRCGQWRRLDSQNQIPDHVDEAGLFCKGDDVSPTQVSATERRQRGRSYKLSMKEMLGLGPATVSQPGKQVLVVSFDLRDSRQPVLVVRKQSHRGGEFGSHGFRATDVGYFVASNGVRILSDTKPGWVEAPRPTLRVWGKEEFDGMEVELPDHRAALRVVQAVVEFNAYLGTGTQDCVRFEK